MAFVYQVGQKEQGMFGGGLRSKMNVKGLHNNNDIKTIDNGILVVRLQFNLYDI